MGERVSVIIPAYGPCPHLGEVVDALLTQSLLPREILVVHSGSDDPTESLADRDPRIDVIHLDERAFAARARNIGLVRAKGDWLAFLDSDVVPVRDWLAELVGAAQASPRRFVVGSVDYAETGGYWGLCLWAIEFSGIHPYLPDGETEGGGSGNMLVPADTARQVRGFPEDFAGGEDSLFAAHLREEGLTNWFCAAARVQHYNISGLAHFSQHLFFLGRWTALCRKAYPLRGATAVRYWPLAGGLWLVRLYLTFGRAVRWGGRHALLSLVLAPGIVGGLLIWNVGVFAGICGKLPKGYMETPPRVPGHRRASS